MRPLNQPFQHIYQLRLYPARMRRRQHILVKTSARYQGTPYPVLTVVISSIIYISIPHPTGVDSITLRV